MPTTFDIAPEAKQQWEQIYDLAHKRGGIPAGVLSLLGFEKDWRKSVEGSMPVPAVAKIDAHMLKGLPRTLFVTSAGVDSPYEAIKALRMLLRKADKHKAEFIEFEPLTHNAQTYRASMADFAEAVGAEDLGVGKYMRIAVDKLRNLKSLPRRKEPFIKPPPPEVMATMGTRTPRPEFTEAAYLTLRQQYPDLPRNALRLLFDIFKGDI